MKEVLQKLLNNGVKISSHIVFDEGFYKIGSDGLMVYNSPDRNLLLFLYLKSLGRVSYHITYSDLVKYTNYSKKPIVWGLKDLMAFNLINHIPEALGQKMEIVMLPEEGYFNLNRVNDGTFKTLTYHQFFDIKELIIPQVLFSHKALLKASPYAKLMFFFYANLALLSGGDEVKYKLSKSIFSTLWNKKTHQKAFEQLVALNILEDLSHEEKKGIYKFKFKDVIFWDNKENEAELSEEEKANNVLQAVKVLAQSNPNSVSLEIENKIKQIFKEVEMEYRGFRNYLQSLGRIDFKIAFLIRVWDKELIYHLPDVCRLCEYISQTPKEQLTFTDNFLYEVDMAVHKVLSNNSLGLTPREAELRLRRLLFSFSHLTVDEVEEKINEIKNGKNPQIKLDKIEGLFESFKKEPERKQRKAKSSKNIYDLDEDKTE